MTPEECCQLDQERGWALAEGPVWPNPRVASAQGIEKESDCAIPPRQQHQAPPARVSAELSRPAPDKVRVKGQKIYGVQVLAVVPQVGTLVDMPRPKNGAKA